MHNIFLFLFVHNKVGVQSPRPGAKSKYWYMDVVSVTTSDNNVLSTVVVSGLRYLLSIVIVLSIVPTNDDECQR